MHEHIGAALAIIADRGSVEAVAEQLSAALPLASIVVSDLEGDE